MPSPSFTAVSVKYNVAEPLPQHCIPVTSLEWEYLKTLIRNITSKGSWAFSAASWFLGASLTLLVSAAQMHAGGQTDADYYGTKASFLTGGCGGLAMALIMLFVGLGLRRDRANSKNAACGYMDVIQAKLPQLVEEDSRGEGCVDFGPRDPK